jgi:hypothetical protein
MEPKIIVEVLGKTGSRTDFLVRVIGPGDTDWRFQLSISDTILAVWGATDNGIRAAKEIVDTIVLSHGTAGAFPEEGYWFDSYNSENTVRETINKIQNFSTTPFLKHRSPSDQISAIYGGDILDKLEQLSFKFFDVTGRPLMGSLDYAFERSEADSDLGSPAANKPEFVYRLCILSVLIDGFRLRLNSEITRTGSLGALKNWLADRFDAETAKSLTETFRQIKQLRKQYPIHEHFERDQAGQRRVREEVTEAETYFEFRDGSFGYEERWKKLCDFFKRAIDNLSVSLDEI